MFINFAYSLIELLVVVVIISIISMVSIHVYSNYESAAQMATIMQFVNQEMQAVEQDYERTGQWPNGISIDLPWSMHCYAPSISFQTYTGNASPIWFGPKQFIGKVPGGDLVVAWQYANWVCLDGASGSVIQFFPIDEGGAIAWTCIAEGNISCDMLPEICRTGVNVVCSN